MQGVPDFAREAGHGFVGPIVGFVGQFLAQSKDGFPVTVSRGAEQPFDFVQLRLHHSSDALILDN